MKPISQENAAFDLAAVRERLRSAVGRRYWRSLDEVAQTAEFTDFLHHEFPAHASEWLGELTMGDYLTRAGLNFR
jgi:MoCo/4Fe-4S cofactor protein with predicted Tat translocation signal